MRYDLTEFEIPTLPVFSSHQGKGYVAAPESLADLTYVDKDEFLSSITRKSVIQPLYRDRFLMVVKIVNGEMDCYAVGEGSRYLEMSLPDEDREMILECHSTAQGRECHEIRHINGKAYPIHGVDLPFRATDVVTREMVERYPDWTDVQSCHHRVRDITAFMVKNGNEWKAWKV